MTEEATVTSSGMTPRSTPSASQWRSAFVFAAVAIPLFVVFFTTSDRALPYHIDPFTNVLTAWSWAEHGHPILDDYAALTNESLYRANLAWVVESPRGPVSQYPPGTALFAAPFYALSSGDRESIEVVGTNRSEVESISIAVPSLVPAAVAASAAVAMAFGFLALGLRLIIGDRAAVATAVVAGLGTGSWPVASNALWQHGPALLCLSIAIWGLSRDRMLVAGLGLGLAALVRPPTLLILGVVGLFVLWRRGLKAATRLGVAAFPGVVAFFAYNYWLWGTVTVSGGYGSGFQDNFTGATPGFGPPKFLNDLVLAFVDVNRGVFVWTPVVAVAVLGIVWIWKGAPDWARALAVGGFVLFLFQTKANGYVGGWGYPSYRYALEWLMATAPLLAWSAVAIARRGSIGAATVALSSLASIGLHAWAVLSRLSA